MNTKHRMSFIDLVRLSFRIFKTKPSRTALTILGMSIGISAVVFLVSLGYGLQYTLIGKLVTTKDSLITISASYPNKSGLNISTSTISDINLLPNSTEVSAIANLTGVVTVNNSSGLIPDIRIAKPNIFRLSGISPDIGSGFTRTKKGIVLSEQALRLVGIKTSKDILGKKVYVNLYFPNSDGTMHTIKIPTQLPIIGIISNKQEPPIAIIPASSVPVIISSYKKIFVKAKNAKTLVTLRNTLTEKGFVISANIDFVTQAEKITNVITIILSVFGITALVVSAIGMFNTMLIGFIERTYEVGVMKSIGATDANVRNLFLMESAVIGTLGGVGGILIGLGLGKLTDAILSFISTQVGGTSLQIFILPLWFGIVVFVLSIAIGIIAGLLPALRAAKLSPREAFTRK